MDCWIYRSDKKTDAYLYVHKEENLNQLPEGLDKLLGKLEFVMQLDLDKVPKLANAEIMEVRACLQERGFYLQLPREEYETI